MRVFALAIELERVIDPAQRLGATAHLLRAGREAPARSFQSSASSDANGRLEVAVGDRLLGDDVVQQVVPQIGGDPHAFDARFGRQDFVRSAHPQSTYSESTGTSRPSFSEKASTQPSGSIVNLSPGA